jgi:hypothetical protein
VLKSETNSQVLSADRQVLFRQVIKNGVLCWQASNGRTFPVVAGAEDGEGDGNTSTTDDYDKERGFKKIQAQAADLKKLKAERDALRAQTKELEALKAKQKEREDAEKSELDRLKEQHAEAERKRADAEQKLIETQNRQKIERAATKANAADPDDVFALLRPSDFEIDDAGAITNADKLVADLLKAKPYLVSQSTTSAPQRGNGAGPKPAGTTAAYADVVKSEEARLKNTGAFNF